MHGSTFVGEKFGSSKIIVGGKLERFVGLCCVRSFFIH